MDVDRKSPAKMRSRETFQKGSCYDDYNEEYTGTHETAMDVDRKSMAKMRSRETFPKESCYEDYDEEYTGTPAGGYDNCKNNIQQTPAGYDGREVNDTQVDECRDDEERMPTLYGFPGTDVRE